MDPMIFINFGLLVATAFGAAVAWRQAIASDRARTDAEKAKDAALSAWRDASDALVRANQISDVTLRGPYAWELLELGTALLAARTAGRSREEVRQLVLDRSRALAKAGFMVGDASTKEILQWVSIYSRDTEIDGIDQYISASELVRARIEMWFRDPQAAIDVIASDPQVAMPD